MLRAGLNQLVTLIPTIDGECDIIPMNTIFAIVLVERFQSGDVRRGFDHLVHPFDRPHLSMKHREKLNPAPEYESRG